MPALSRGVLDFTPQAAEGVTYAKKIDKAETRIDWSRPAREVHNHIRGLSPDPGAWFEADLGKGAERVKVLRSTLAEGAGAPGTVLDDELTVACGDGRGPARRAAARRQAAGQGGRVPARPARAAAPGVALMPRFKLTIEYDGGPFVGWQRQENGRSVQQAIEEAIAAFSGETVVVKGAGRTDAGVHALGQVAHVDLARDWPADTVRDALNAHLKPEPVAILVGRGGRRRFRRALLGGEAPLPLPHHRPPRAAGARPRPRLAGRRAARRRGHARAPPRRSSASTTSPPSAPPSARRSRR